VQYNLICVKSVVKSRPTNQAVIYPLTFCYLQFAIEYNSKLLARYSVLRTFTILSRLVHWVKDLPIRSGHGSKV